MAKKDDNTMLYIIGGVALLFLLRSRSQVAGTQTTAAAQLAANTAAQLLPVNTIDQRGGPAGIKLDLLPDPNGGMVYTRPGAAQAGYMTRDGYSTPPQPLSDPRFYGPPIIVDDDGNVLPFPGKNPGPPQPIDPSYN